MLERWRARGQEAEEAGKILARLHWQCWRADPPPVEVTDAEFIRVMPLVIGSGSVGLVWPRLRERFNPNGAVALAMEAAFKAQVAHNAKVERDLAAVVTRLRDAGVEPLLIKGLAVARLYPPGLVRPAGDIDLVVREEDFAHAEVIVAEPGLQSVGVDLKHPRIWEEIPNLDFWTRTNEIDLVGTTVEILGAEDQLWMLSIHFLKHGGQRPVWLCDVAAALESFVSEHECQMNSISDQIVQGWVNTAIAVARDQLGANVEGLQSRKTQGSVPKWLLREIYEEWTEPTPFNLPGASTVLLGSPSSVFSVLCERWPNPLVATIHTRAPINGWSRLPWQVLFYVRRIAGHVIHRMAAQVLESRRVPRSSSAE